MGFAPFASLEGDDFPDAHAPTPKQSCSDSMADITRIRDYSSHRPCNIMVQGFKPYQIGDPTGSTLYPRKLADKSLHDDLKSCKGVVAGFESQPNWGSDWFYTKIRVNLLKIQRITI